jgi:hypothetical protein
MKKQRAYVGIDNDEQGGMTDIGRIIRDAWVFDLISETETCQGWTLERIQALYDQVNVAWEPYGHLVSRLPPELRERHSRIYAQAVKLAREKGWNPELDDEAEG